MAYIPYPARREGSPHGLAHRNPTCDEISVIIAGHSGVAELWCGSSLLGILHEEHAGIVLRLESHASGPLAVDAVALERALAQARELLTAATSGGDDGAPGDERSSVLVSVEVGERERRTVTNS